MRKFSRWIVFVLLGVSVIGAQTSEDHPKLKQALQKYPQADANKDGVLTMAEAQAFKSRMKKRGKGKVKSSSETIEITYENLAYGDDPKQKIDLWLAKSDEPTPLLVCIHGGGFKGGDKAKFHRDPIVKEMLNQGISVATINYRLTDGGENPFPIPMHDGARAIQFLRHHAEKYNLEKTRVAATGGSAGGCMSLWLALHDDLADASSSDPIARESTRLTAILPKAAQSTLSMKDFIEIFDCENLKEHGGFRPLFALPLEGEVEMTTELEKMMTAASPVTHLTTDDPPVYMFYNGADVPVDESSSPGIVVHHPKLGLFLKEKMDELDVECYVEYKDGEAIEQYESGTAFIISKLKG